MMIFTTLPALLLLFLMRRPARGLAAGLSHMRRWTEQQAFFAPPHLGGAYAELD